MERIDQGHVVLYEGQLKVVEEATWSSKGRNLKLNGVSESILQPKVNMIKLTKGVLSALGFKKSNGTYVLGNATVSHVNGGFETPDGGKYVHYLIGYKSLDAATVIKKLSEPIVLNSIIQNSVPAPNL